MTPHKHRLGVFPTPLQKIPLFLERYGVSLNIKHEATSHYIIGGTKLRSLEYIFHELSTQNITDVISLGDINSNQCKIISILAKKFNINCHLFIRTPENRAALSSNHLFTKIANANIISIPVNKWLMVSAIANRLLEKLKRENKKPYFIPFGCGGFPGFFGIMELGKELLPAISSASQNYIITPVGSGSLYFALTHFFSQNINTNVVGICPFEENNHRHAHRFKQWTEELKSFILPINNLFENLHFNVPLHLKTLDEMTRVFQEYEVLLDPHYVLPVFLYFESMIKNNYFQKGSNIIFINTGSINLDNELISNIGHL